MSVPLSSGDSQDSAKKRSLRSEIEAFIPKSVVALREGYQLAHFWRDLAAGLTVGVVALPLAMAFAINSGPGLTPQMGLYTAIIAGFLVSLLGGSRVQIAGPTGAFMPILYLIVQRHGYEGLAVATVMAGVILIIMGLAKFGGMIKFIPYPVTTGFTAGIAVIIFSSQMKDFFGLQMGNPPPEFVGKWAHYVYAVRESGVNPYATGIAIAGVLVIWLVRKFAPRVPGMIVAVVLGSLAVAMLDLESVSKHGEYAVSTIGSKFGGIPRALPQFQLDTIYQAFTLERVRDLMPEAATIALLAAVESLLCCVVADGMIGGRHKSNLELMAQGVANIGSMLFGGIPATGAIARTAVNIKSGGRTPVAGMIHSAFVLACILLLAPLASKIPIPIFASILVVVAWNMSQRDHFRSLLRAPRSDIAVLLATFGLTVLTDLTVAVGVGMVLAAMLFMKRMSEVTNVSAIDDELENGVGDELADMTDPNAVTSRDVPPGVEVYEINGPFFFGVADRLKDTLREVGKPPRVFILRMRRVPAIDATGMHALDEFDDKCRKQGTRLLLSGVHTQPVFAMMRYGLTDKIGEENMFGNIDDALNRAREILGLSPMPKPEAAVPEVARERT